MSSTDSDAPPADGLRGPRVRIDQAERLEIMRRIDAGESQAALAREFGCSRQYISQLRGRFTQFGAWGIETRPRGRPKARPLDESLQQAIRSAIDTSRPSEHGLASHHDLGDAWHIDAVRDMVKMEKGWKPTRGQIIELFERWNLSRDHFRTWKPPRDSETLDPDFEEWSRSPIARRIREREVELQEQAEVGPGAGAARGEGKVKAAPAKPTKPAHTSTSGPSPPSPPDDFDADFQAFLQDFEQSLHEVPCRKVPLRTPSRQKPGVRTGKHAKAKSRTKRKSKRRR